MYLKNCILEVTKFDILDSQPIERMNMPNFPLKFSTFQDLMEDETRQRWIVDDLIPRNSISMMFGAPKAGKSFVAYDLALHIANGMPWCGKDVERGAVFVVCGEGRIGVTKRIKAWGKHYIQNGDWSKVPFFLSERAVKIGAEGEAEILQQVIHEMCMEHKVHPALVVIDTVARCFGAGDESSNQDMGNFISLIDNYIKSAFNTSVLLIHHTGHMSKQRARGASALSGALDAAFSISSTKNPAGGLLIDMETQLMKDGDSDIEMSFKAGIVDVTHWPDGKIDRTLLPIFNPAGSSSVTVGRSPQCEMILSIVEELDGEIDRESIKKIFFERWQWNENQTPTACRQMYNKAFKLLYPGVGD